MSIAPTPTQLLAQIREAVLAIYPVITANLSTSGYATVSRAGVKHWTTYISALKITQDGLGEGNATGECTVRCVYHGDPVNSTNQAEADAQAVLVAAVTEFAQRPHLQSEDVPNGVDCIDIEGIPEVSGDIEISTGEKTRFSVWITLTLPLLFQIEILEFER